MLRAMRLAFLLAMLANLSLSEAAQISGGANAPSSSSSSAAAVAPHFDINTAVETYLAKMPPARRARSDAYFEGGYWLLLWDFLLMVFVMWLLLHFRLSSQVRNFAERVTRFRILQNVVYWIQFVLLASILLFPMTVYEGYLREHQYDLLNQTFGLWMRDQLIGLAATVILGAILVIPLFGVVRRGFDHRLPGVRKSDCSGLYRSAVQQVHKIVRRADQGTHSQHGARQRYPRD